MPVVRVVRPLMVSVCPPAPNQLFQPPVSYGPKVWKEETGENRYRRGLYTFRYRSVPYPALQAFDKDSEPRAAPNVLTRLTLDPARRAIVGRAEIAKAEEFPRFDTRRVGRRYGQGFVAANHEDVA